MRLVHATHHNYRLVILFQMSKLGSFGNRQTVLSLSFDPCHDWATFMWKAQWKRMFSVTPVSCCSQPLMASTFAFLHTAKRALARLSPWLGMKELRRCHTLKCWDAERMPIIINLLRNFGICVQQHACLRWSYFVLPTSGAKLNMISQLFYFLGILIYLLIIYQDFLHFRTLTWKSTLVLRHVHSMVCTKLSSKTKTSLRLR